jgi:antitoxin CptB
MRELDLLLGGFLDSEYASLSPGSQRDFVALLKYPDQDILEWITGRSSPPSSLSVLTEHLIAHLSNRRQ